MSSRARRRGGRGRRRPPRSAPPAPRSLWQRLLGLLRLRPADPAGRRDRDGTEAQEQRVFREFARQYGIPFKDVSLLKLALTHRSYLSVTGQGAKESNERLEFLGDSVLGLVTSEFLYRRHPEEHEGQLTKIKSLLVSKAILSRRALKMGLGRYVLMSRSEVESGGRQRLSILADAFESVLGAIYLDQGFETARAFIHEHLLTDADDIAADKRHTNYKSHLQEYVQSTYRTHPVYRIRSEYGPDHSKYFMVEVMVGRRLLGEGRGHNKKEAEQAAARDAIERVGELRRAASEERRGSRPESEEEAFGEPELAAADPREEPEAADSVRRGRRRRGGRSRSRDDHRAGARTPAEREADAEAELAEEAEARGEPRFEREPVAGPDEDDRGGAVDPDRDEDGAPGDESAERPQVPPAGPAARTVVAFGRGRRGRLPPQAGTPDPPAPEEQRHVDPFAFEAERADAAGEPAAESEEDRDALIEEMERAMESFGRRTRGSRRRSR